MTDIYAPSWGGVLTDGLLSSNGLWPVLGHTGTHIARRFKQVCEPVLPLCVILVCMDVRFISLLAEICTQLSYI